MNYRPNKKVVLAYGFGFILNTIADQFIPHKSLFVGVAIAGLGFMAINLIYPDPNPKSAQKTTNYYKVNATNGVETTEKSE